MWIIFWKMGQLPRVIGARGQDVHDGVPGTQTESGAEGTDMLEITVTDDGSDGTSLDC